MPEVVIVRACRQHQVIIWDSTLPHQHALPFYINSRYLRHQYIGILLLPQYAANRRGDIRGR